MKLRLTLGIILISILIGCSPTTESVSEHPVSSINQDQQSPEKKMYPQDDAIAAFNRNKHYSDYEVTDYVVVKDDALPMLKAVISFYDHIENNSCNLAFIYGDTIQRIGFAVNETDGVKTYEIADNSRLTYVGDGAVTTSIREIDTNEIIDYKITFSYDKSTSTTNFEVVAEKPTK
ncbi:hypothetical protein [Sporosarcina sp. Te-1]|uniref:hypothetical protein n=1 Tax=Sporosarcina sp. Te-1 TaxID=2818390 RepID=UPI001A9D5C9B|nr:hypothetical protein [Sporosarcina sp. Te-1]QTD40327.1 hypothetical protein J3U78_16255 [Sporosarcina sp. Te-1]